MPPTPTDLRRRRDPPLRADAVEKVADEPCEALQIGFGSQP
jgi:hypothetical protein